MCTQWGESYFLKPLRSSSGFLGREGAVRNADRMRQYQMQGMWNNPAFLQQMSSLMSNPAIVDQIIASNPQLAGMGPQVRQVFQSEQFRQMMYVLLAPIPLHLPTSIP